MLAFYFIFLFCLRFYLFIYNMKSWYLFSLLFQDELLDKMNYSFILICCVHLQFKNVIPFIVTAITETRVEEEWKQMFPFLRCPKIIPIMKFGQFDCIIIFFKFASI